jgi:uncharacterized tellurite resistance protein B-like protein/GTPase SAR1 family protein
MITPQIIELLSRITGKKLDTRDITPPVLFLAALITILLGVMLADKKVTEEEKQRWQKTLNRFIPLEGDVRQLAQLLSKGIREQKLYANSNKISTLLEPFSECEKLLLVGLGYEMASADGAIADLEKKYLYQIATVMGMQSSYLDVLEAGFTQQLAPNSQILEEIKFLLDPVRFQELDTLFVKAASDLLSTLPAIPEKKILNSQVTSYAHLKDFQNSRKQLDSLYHQLHEIIQNCSERNLLPNSFVEDVIKISSELRSQRFRVAVIGEFSRGKSTLINALLGEDIQPVEIVPCSSTITVLRYGNHRKITCFYKNGQQEEISVAQYKEKASLSEEEALEYRSDKLASSEIEEIVFEHPDLNLCINGVEIIDSPGLNEHPDRTTITKKLLRNADAVLFLIHAASLLSEGEKELLHDIRKILTGSTDKLPAENVFVLVNFIDLVENERDYEKVTRRLESFIRNENIVPLNKGRIHYISAKAALKKQDKYLQSFNLFTQEFERFLTVERGSIEITHCVNHAQNLIHMSLMELQQAENLLDGRVALSKTETQKVLEQIGEVSGREVRIRILHDQLLEIVSEETNESWNQWVENLGSRLAEKVEKWSSDHSAIWSRDQLVADYAKQFNDNLSDEINDWMENQLKQAILQPALEYFDEEVQKELNAIQAGITDIDTLKEFHSPNWVFYRDKNFVFDDFSFLGNLGIAGLGVAVFVPAIILAGPVLLAVGTLVASGLFGTGVGGILGIDAEIRAKVFEKGCEQFVESLNKTFENIDEIVVTALNERFERVDEIVLRAISLYENLLEQQNEAHQKNLEQRETEIAWITQKRLELENLRNNVEAFLKTEVN